jgi:hypothetical protein
MTINTARLKERGNEPAAVAGLITVKNHSAQQAHDPEVLL